MKEPSKAARSLAQEIAEASQVGCAGFIRPVHKSWEISSNFGPRWGRNHNGVDLAAPTGEPILAADSGEVTFAGWEPSGYGYLVEVTTLSKELFDSFTLQLYLSLYVVLSVRVLSQDFISTKDVIRTVSSES